MFMASKRCLTSKDDIGLRVVFNFCVRLEISPVEKHKIEFKTPLQPDRAHDTELEIDLLGISLLS